LNIGSTTSVIAELDSSTREALGETDLPLAAAPQNYL
jgi:hypothetical protein